MCYLYLSWLKPTFCCPFGVGINKLTLPPSISCSSVNNDGKVMLTLVAIALAIPHTSVQLSHQILHQHRQHPLQPNVPSTLLACILYWLGQVLTLDWLFEVVPILTPLNC